ncbi:hypothetical protein BGW38_008521 [Lunasporangiospora selenospora]|uniref:Selenoprotein W-related protein n=1 Tax=Lunasporangiospora selenospora TaxID=979761 RepID=A0A9P6KIJ4_9FUNG|nr:hypothetical protein BGW38_008521 [Lunasporangiospora selenospora]
MPIENRLPRVEIEFCTGCKWHLRAGWMAQELLLTFNNTVGEVALIPGKSAVFIVRVNGDVVYDRKEHGRFPEMKELKQLIRNVIAPEMGLGHSDSAVKSASNPGKADIEPTTVVPAAVAGNDVKDNEEGVVPPAPECKTCQ